MTETATGLDHDPTARALDDLRTRARKAARVGAGLVLLGLALALPAAATENELLGRGALTLWCLGSWSVTLAALTFRDTRHMTRTLRTRPWTRCLAEVTKGPWTGTRIVLRDPRTDTLVRLRCRRPRPDLPDKNGPLWWSGTAAEGGVLSRPGGDRPVRATACR